MPSNNESSCPPNDVSVNIRPKKRVAHYVQAHLSLTTSLHKNNEVQYSPNVFGNILRLFSYESSF